MKVRSVGLAVVGAGLLVAAGVLGAILVHDGETDAPPLSAARPGDAIEVKGVPTAFHPSGSLAAWQPILPMLGERTYQVAPAGDGVLVLLTGDEAAPEGDVVLAEGTVAYVGPNPDGSATLLVLVQVQAWREPLLFR